jgi:hypothetical protein
VIAKERLGETRVHLIRRLGQDPCKARNAKIVASQSGDLVFNPAAQRHALAMPARQRSVDQALEVS